MTQVAPPRLMILVDTFLTGELANPEAAAARKPAANYFSTYNRSDLQERVQDLITTCAFAQGHNKGRKIVLIGEGRAGIWALLAAPAADAIIADADALDVGSDEALLASDLFVPGIRRLGFESMAQLAAPRPLMVHNAGAKFSFPKSKAMRLSAAAVTDWIIGLKVN